MSLGKRPRPPMRRTTSMSEFAPDLGAADSDPVPEGVYRHRNPHPRERKRAAEGSRHQPPPAVAAAAAMLPPPGSGQRRHTVDLTTVDLMAVEVAEFLRACGLCKRRLGPGRDTFIYMGDAAFCSLECREQQMKQDERKEKCSSTLMKADAPPPTSGPEATGSSKTVAAA